MQIKALALHFTGACKFCTKRIAIETVNSREKHSNENSKRELHSNSFCWKFAKVIRNVFDLPSGFVF